tara:strand:+ start:2109 stop:2867 length:759 start_codon:yes stop_codon:yes gene_type:complete
MSLPITKDEFIQDVRDEITVSCSLPFSPPVKDISRIVKYAEKWFHKKYEDSVEERYYRIPKSCLSDDNFKISRTVIMPSNIFSVINVAKSNDGFGSHEPFKNMADFSLEKALFKNLNDISQSSEALMMYVAFESFIDMNRQLLNHPVSWKFNRNTRELFIAGEVPTSDLILTTLNTIPIESLMADEIFFRYVVAKAKTQLGRILGTFEFQYAGGVSVNTDLYASEGKEELDKIEEELKTDEGADWFFTTGGA